MKKINNLDSMDEIDGLLSEVLKMRDDFNSGATLEIDHPFETYAKMVSQIVENEKRLNKPFSFRVALIVSWLNESKKRGGLTDIQKAMIQKTHDNAKLV